VLLSVAGGSDLGLFEINEAAQLVAEAAHPEANIIFGAVIDDALGDEVRVTVIAAGFDGGAPRPARQASRRPAVETAARPADTVEEAINISSAPATSVRIEHQPAERVVPAPAPARLGLDESDAARRESAGPRRTIFFDDDADELDVPDFLK
jgi:cell division protein FtsZ